MNIMIFFFQFNLRHLRLAHASLQTICSFHGLLTAKIAGPYLPAGSLADERLDERFVVKVSFSDRHVTAFLQAETKHLSSASL
jgi:hypothetical protein